MYGLAPLNSLKHLRLQMHKKRLLKKTRAFIESEKERIFAKFEAAEREILSLKKPGAACADFIEFVKNGLN